MVLMRLMVLRPLMKVIPISGAMVTAANKVIAVLDSSKFNRRGFNQVLPIEKIDIIITDDAVSEVDKLALQKTRVKLITV